MSAANDTTCAYVEPDPTIQSATDMGAESVTYQRLHLLLDVDVAIPKPGRETLSAATIQSAINDLHDKDAATVMVVLASYAVGQLLEHSPKEFAQAAGTPEGRLGKERMLAHALEYTHENGKRQSATLLGDYLANNLRLHIKRLAMPPENPSNRSSQAQPGYGDPEGRTVQ